MPLFKKTAVNGRPLVQLSDVHLRVLRRCRMILVKDLNPLDVLHFLTPEDGFKQDVRDSILGLCSSDKQVGAILDHLETQSDEAFGSFMDILREQYKHLHRVLVETSRTLDETDEDQTRERTAIVGDSIRKLLRHSARRQLQDHSRKGSSETPGDYYVDNLGNDGDDVGQYIGCYTIPTRGKLQKEKWIRHVTSTKDQISANSVSKEPYKSSEVILVHDVTFRLIGRSDILRDVEVPPKTCECIYAIKREENDDNERKNKVVKDSDVNDSLKQNDAKTKQVERSKHCPPPLPPKPDILSLSGRNLLKSISLPKDNLSDSEKFGCVPADLEVKTAPLVYVSEEEKNLTPSFFEKKTEDLSAPPLPVRRSQEKSDDVKSAKSSFEERTKDHGEAKITSTPPLPIRKPHTKPDSADHSIGVKKDTRSPPISSCSGQEQFENGSKNKPEVSGDEDDDNEDTLSLNYDVGIEEEDGDTCDNAVSPADTRDRSRTVASVSGLSIVNKRTNQCSPTTAVGDGILLSVQRTLPMDAKRMESLHRFESISLGQNVPVDILGSVECSHYEEIEPRDEGFLSEPGFYLDPRSYASVKQRSIRRRECQNGMSAFTANHLRVLDSPKQIILNKGTLLIVKSNTEIHANDTAFDKTFLGYDHMGFAYYVPVDSVKHYGDPSNEKWFYPIEMTVKEATLFLNCVNQKGCFVVYRPSGRRDPSLRYCLSISLGTGDALHYNIVENVHGDVMIEGHDHSFMHVCDLVDYFHRNQSSLATRLRRPLKEAGLPIMPGYHYDSCFEIPRREIALSSVAIDKGMFGDYRLGDFKGISVKVSVMRTEPSATNDDDFLEEGLMMMMTTEHENIVRLMGVSCCVRPYCIIMEHIDRGTLGECLQNRIIPPDNIDSLFDICIQLVAAMSYLESLSFMLHRNLSTRSFFVTADLLVKLGSFDRARHVADDNYQGPLSEEVMVRWAAPEVLTGSTYSTKSDVWSLGVVFWEVFSQGACPYMPCGVEQVAVYVTEGGKLEKPPGCAPDLWSMMKSCWKLSPSDRPTFAMLQDKIKGKSSVYYASPVRSSTLPSRNTTAMESVKGNGSVPSKSKSSRHNRSAGSDGKVSALEMCKRSVGGAASNRRKRSKSANRGMHNRILRDEKEATEKRSSSVIRNGERARTPSSDSSSIVSGSVMNDSCDDLDRVQKARKSWKNLLK